jgi:hypothetical protein
MPFAAKTATTTGRLILPSNSTTRSPPDCGLTTAAGTLTERGRRLSSCWHDQTPNGRVP